MNGLSFDRKMALCALLVVALVCLTASAQQRQQRQPSLGMPALGANGKDPRSMMSNMLQQATSRAGDMPKQIREAMNRMSQQLSGRRQGQMSRGK